MSLHEQRNYEQSKLKNWKHITMTEINIFDEVCLC
jgi:hypothetical protein